MEPGTLVKLPHNWRDYKHFTGKVIVIDRIGECAPCKFPLPYFRDGWMR